MDLLEKIDHFLTGVLIFLFSGLLTFGVLTLGVGTIKFCWDYVANNPINTFEWVAMGIVTFIGGIFGVVAFLCNKAK